MTNQESILSQVGAAIDAIRNKGMVIMVDDEDRENEGDLVFAAEHVCPEKINFMTKEARGLICLTLTPKTIDQLKLPMMADTTKTGDSRSTAFTVSIEARDGVSTGISAADRCQTIRVAVGPDTTPEVDLFRADVFCCKN
jgi:3,4-dihydroxy 2-butanone 4-phosphate synthase/GTP cyclohydrolase II